MLGNNTFHINEQQLIDALKNDSQKAFNSIYTIYAKRLFAYAIQYTKSVQDAEEIVEDVFVHLWLERKVIRQSETLRALLFIMAKHYLINAYRARINSPVFEDYVDYQESITDNNHTQIEYDEFVKQVYKAIDKLPQTQKNVITLSKIQQLNNKEIAERLSLNEQTVKNQLSLGLKTLKQELYKSFPFWWLLFFVY
jgi:RNA polymerase sigma-70 factor (ECF subfamily)